jgi:hypothetical protein
VKGEKLPLFPFRAMADSLPSLNRKAAFRKLIAESVSCCTSCQCASEYNRVEIRLRGQVSVMEKRVESGKGGRVPLQLVV